MNEKQKTRPVAGTTEREAAEMTVCRASIPISNYITTVVDRQLKISELKISDLLSNGRENALPLRCLVSITGRDSRTVRLMIEQERRNGVPIVSDNQNGYWLANNPAEAQMFARSMRHRAGEIIRTARAIEVAAGID